MWRVLCILLTIVSAANAAGHGSTNNNWPIGSATITVAGTGICGAVPCTATVNSISPTCFTNPADTVAANTNWTSSSTNYLKAPSSAQFVLQGLTSCQSRDVEVQTWMAKGYVYVRLDNQGNALYFYHDVTQTNGYLEVGVVQGLNQGSFPAGHYYPLWTNNNLIGIIGASGSLCSCGYSRTASDSQKFTFGANGFTIYVKYQGTQFLSFLDYRQMSSGVVAFQADNGTGGNGFRDILVTPLTTAQLASDYAHIKYNLTDWGLRSSQTTGSMTSGSNCLTVALTVGFKIGDFIIVEIGGEGTQNTIPAGDQGTMGVGGSWPTLKYTSLANMNADTSQTQQTFAWINDSTGQVRQWTGSYSAWSSGTTYAVGTFVSYTDGNNYESEVGGNIGNTPSTSPTFWLLQGATSVWQPDFYYSPIGSTPPPYHLAKATPMSLQGRISAIGSCNGANSFTLITPTSDPLNSPTSANASFSTTNANVYLDNQVYFADLLQIPRTIGSGASTSPTVPNYMDLIVPAGTYYLGGMVTVGGHFGATIEGQGTANTTLQSPKGIRNLGFQGGAMNNWTIKNMTMNGNFGLNGYGLAWANSLTPITPASQTYQYNAAGTIIVYNTAVSPVITQTSVGNGDWFQMPGVFYSNSDSDVASNITYNDFFTSAVSCNNATNCSANNITINLHTAQQNYTQWQAFFGNPGTGSGIDTGGGCSTCTFTGQTMTTAFSCAASSNITFSNITTTNGSMESNGCNNATFSNINITVQANASAPAWTPANGIIQIDNNGNACGTPSAINCPLGVALSNITINTQGFLDSNNNVSPGVIVNAVRNITFSGTNTFTGPGFSTHAGISTHGNVGVNSGASLNTTISGWTICGTTDTPTYSNITTDNGTVTGNTADTIQSGFTAGNTIPCP